MVRGYYQAETIRFRTSFVNYCGCFIAFGEIFIACVAAPGHTGQMIFILLAAGALAIYLVSVFEPKTAEHFRSWVTPFLARMEERAEQAPGILGWLLKGPFWASRKTVNESTKLGEETREKA
jgi:hypothetical protein